MNNLVVANKTKLRAADSIKDFVTMRVAGQLFGIPVMLVQDVLRPQKITPIPLAPKEVAGSLNLRGRIVTAIDVRKRLGLEARAEKEKYMLVAVEHKNDIYSLVVDSVGEVLSLSIKDFQANPTNLNPNWQQVSLGIYRLKEELLIVLDAENLLSFDVSGKR
jgi:purine-binding chemotaxis protein CheW